MTGGPWPTCRWGGRVGGLSRREGTRPQLQAALIYKPYRRSRAKVRSIGLIISNDRVMASKLMKNEGAKGYYPICDSTIWELLRMRKK
jgi:hypothetical protein